MIYFDNAATSRPKPESVYEAFNYFVRQVGVSPGRGSYSLAIQASRMLYLTRKTVASFFGSSDPSCVIFTKNSTEAINLFFNGFLSQGDHVLISPYEHNAVLRPLHTLKENGIIEYTVLPEDVFYNDPHSLNKYIRENTKLIAVTLASNLTGQIVYNSEIGSLAHSNNLKVFVDASQGAGKKLLNISRDNIDILAFTGHKDLLALPGVGGLVSLHPLGISPLIQGGTGVHGESYVNPDIFPDAYESGTLNMPAIWSLKASMDYIDSHLNQIYSQEKILIDHAINRLLELDNVTIYNVTRPRVSTFCFNIKNVPSSMVVQTLDNNGICVRGGIHCAIKAHETLGTVSSGAVRVSLNHFNTLNEVNSFIDIVSRIK